MPAIAMERAVHQIGELILQLPVHQMRQIVPETSAACRYGRRNSIEILRHLFERERFGVQTLRRHNRIAQIVDHDVVEHGVFEGWREFLPTAQRQLPVRGIRPRGELLHDIRQQTDRRLRQHCANRVRFGCLQMHVTRLLDQEQKLLRGRIEESHMLRRGYETLRPEAGQEFLDVHEWRIREAHVGMVAQYVLWERCRNAAAQRAAPVTALNGEALVTEAQHQVAQHHRHFDDAEITLGRALRPTVAGQARHDHLEDDVTLESVGRNQFRDELVEFAHGTGPAVEQKERHGAPTGRLSRRWFRMNVVDVEPAHMDGENGQ